MGGKADGHTIGTLDVHKKVVESRRMAVRFGRYKHVEGIMMVYAAY